MINIIDSFLFLSISRDIISEMFTEKDLKYFIQYEASDYQIINIIINNEIPKEKYNINKEYKLWNKFKQLIYENTNNKSLKKIIIEMGPICEYNLSSCKSIQNLQEAGDQPKFIQSLFNKLSTIKKNAKSAAQKGTTAAAKLTADTAKKGNLNSIAVGMTAGAAAGIIAFTAAKIYQNYLSKAARSCSGKPDKVACMRDFKNKALRMQMDKLKSGIGVCRKAKNSNNCKKSLQAKIGKLQIKIDSV